MNQTLWERVQPWLTGSLASRTYWKPIFWGVREAILREVLHLGIYCAITWGGTEGSCWPPGAVGSRSCRRLAVQTPHTAKERGEENRVGPGGQAFFSSGDPPVPSIDMRNIMPGEK